MVHGVMSPKDSSAWCFATARDKPKPGIPSHSLVQKSPFAEFANKNHQTKGAMETP
jgi:hypothetical protein